MTFELQEPLYLLFFLLAVMLSLLANKQLFSKRSFIEKSLLPWAQLSKMKASRWMSFYRSVLYFLMWFCFALAVSGPQVLSEAVADELRKSSDTFILLDVSKSMLVEDVQPNRISQAKVEIINLIERSQGDRFGLIIFAGKSVMLNPLTRDKKVLLYYLSQVESGLLSVSGSRLDLAIALARQRLVKSAQSAKAIVVVSDGDFDNGSNEVLLNQQLEKLQASNITLFSLGLGTLTGGGIPDGSGQWLRHNDQVVVSQLNQTLLTHMAKVSGGHYVRANQLDSDTTQLYEDGIARLASYQISKTDQKHLRWQYYYTVPLIVAMNCLFLIVLQSFISMVFVKAKLKAEEEKKLKQKIRLKYSIVLFFSFLLMSACSSSSQDTAMSFGLKHYENKRYKLAYSYFAKNYNQESMSGVAASAYRLKRYVVAVRYYSIAFRLASNDEARAMSLFNMANAYFHLRQYQAALQLYSDALIYKVDYQKAKDNMQITQEVYANVLKDSGHDDSITSRVGKGPQFRRALPGLELDRGSASLDNNEELDKDKKQNYEYDTNRTLSKALINSRQLQLKVNSVKNEKSNRIIRTQSAFVTEQKILNIDSDSSYMWQRMFYFENKIFIPDGESMILPETKPW